jgi:hypothetical protein
MALTGGKEWRDIIERRIWIPRCHVEVGRLTNFKKCGSPKNKTPLIKAGFMFYK